DAPPASPGTATLSDYMSGVYAALGVLVALQSREKTGNGQIVDVGLYESVFRILDELAPAYAYKDFVRERMGAGTVNAVPHSHYPSKDGLWVAIACTNDKIFNRLANLMDRNDVTGDGIYGTIAMREAKRAEVDAFVTNWTTGLTRDEILNACEVAEVPCGPVYSIEEIFNDPQYKARENLVEINDPRLGSITLPNVCPRLTETPGQISWAGRALGADTQDVLKDWLGE
ncbi:MAG: CoA transferase, partial [Pseudomonadota bacterium]|nr:CoA transferase [Pseudomonadota bacterium]